MKLLHTIALCSCLFSAVGSANTQNVVLPENAQVAWISESINQDGMLLAIQTFYSDEPVESVLEFYREAWHKEGELPGFVENTLGDWAIISQLRDDSNVVLQIKPDETGAAAGFLSTAKKNPGIGKPTNDFPMPDGTEQFSSSYMEEDDAEVLTMSLISTQSVGNAVSFYKSKLAGKGWELAREHDVDGNQIMLFNRNADRCELVVSQLDGESTVIHVNRVKRNG